MDNILLFLGSPSSTAPPLAEPFEEPRSPPTPRTPLPPAEPAPALAVPESPEDDILAFLGALSTPPRPAAPPPPPPPPLPGAPHAGLIHDGAPPAAVPLWGRSLPAIASVERNIAWGDAMRARRHSSDALGAPVPQYNDAAYEATLAEEGEEAEVEVVGLDSAPPSPRRPVEGGNWCQSEGA
eukprot:scaffold31271_cov68-Phaeocystis_antarctica.AAC.9